MVGALKGHTAPVLDMDFSANGKFLASCAEDCGLAAKEELSAEQPESSSSSSSSSSRRRNQTVVVAAADSTTSTAVPAPSSSTTTTTVANDNQPEVTAVAPPSPTLSTKSNSSTKSSSSSSSSSATSSSASRGSSAGGSSSFSSNTEDHQRAILSRRQRKNRMRAPREQRRELRERDEDLEDDHNAPPPPRHRATKANVSNAPNAASKFKPKQKPAQEQKKPTKAAEVNKKPNVNQIPQDLTIASRPGQLHNLNNGALTSMLRRYLLTCEQMHQYGYPIQLNRNLDFGVMINHFHPYSQRLQNAYQYQYNLDANAREFVPVTSNSSNENDSGRGSASSSVESSDLEQESNSDSSSDIASDSDKGSSEESSSDSDKSSEPGDAEPKRHHQAVNQRPLAWQRHNTVERRCTRCHKQFLVRRTDNEYIQEEKCSYHWGKLRNMNGHGDGQGNGQMWECCRGREWARGCTQARTHVWSGIVLGFNGPYHDFVATRPARHRPRDGNYGIYAVDCEMVFTKFGLELGKVTVVTLNGRIHYETLVKPDSEILDYNTRFSGLRPKDLAKATKNIRDVQRDMLSFVHAETILIGHGLENDLRALRLLHHNVVDTGVAFPHYLGHPYRSSLKTLAKHILRKEIQVKEHDSAEDARTVVDLMFVRLHNDFF